jgi:fatty-acyl-CoA synthase
MNEQREPWVDGLTFAEVLRRTVCEHGHRDAVVFPQLGLRWSYARLEAEAGRYARALLALGVQPNDRVGIWSTNWPQYITAQFGTAMLGAILVNVNPAYRVHELSYVLKQADLVVLLLTDIYKSSHYESMLAEAVPELGTARYCQPLPSREFPRPFRPRNWKNCRPASVRRCRSTSSTPREPRATPRGPCSPIATC